MNQNHRRAAPAIDPTKQSSLFEVPLMDLIAEKVEALCGYRPGPEDVEAFLVELSGSGSDTKAAVSTASPKTTTAMPISEKKISYKIFGQSKQASNAIDALLDILRTLAAKDQNFIERLSPLVRGRTRNHIARKREDVYPEKPELIEYTTQLVPGWWLGTNISNRDKLKIIEKACEVKQLSLGKDISIKLPNTKSGP